MRKIDFYVGVPLCFLSSVLGRLFRKDPRFGQAKRVLFIELSEMGSAILVDPAMKRLRKNFKATLYFVIFKKNKPSLGILKTIPEENIFLIRDDSFISLTLDTLRLLWWIRKNQIDTVVDLELFSRFTSLITSFSGAHNRVGFYGYYNEGLYRGDMLTHKVAYNPHIHISKNFLSLVHSLESPVIEVPFSKTLISDEETKLDQIQIEPSQQERFVKKLEGIVPGFNRQKNRLMIVNANASDMLPQRRWMPEYFSAVIQHTLGDHPDIFVVLSGSQSERSSLDSIVQQVSNGRCVNLAGKIEFSELTLLYSVSVLMLTNDSGPAHFASVTQLPTYVIFGPETPALYGSLGNFYPIYAGLACSPCVNATNHRKTACRNNVCLQVIKPERVYQQISAHLR